MNHAAVYVGHNGGVKSGSPVVGTPEPDPPSDQTPTRSVVRVAAVAAAAGLLGFLFGVITNAGDESAPDDSAPTETFSPLAPTNAGVDSAPSDLVLTIDREMQLLAQQALADALAETGAIAGTVVVLDVETKAFSIVTQAAVITADWLICSRRPIPVNTTMAWCD